MSRKIGPLLKKAPLCLEALCSANPKFRHSEFVLYPGLGLTRSFPESATRSFDPRDWIGSGDGHSIEFNEYIRLQVHEWNLGTRLSIYSQTSL